MSLHRAWLRLASSGIPASTELTDVTAKVVIYEAFVEGRLEAPKHLARAVHDLPQFKATAKLGEFLEPRFPQWYLTTAPVSANHSLLLASCQTAGESERVADNDRLLEPDASERPLRSACDLMGSITNG